LSSVPQKTARRGSRAPHGTALAYTQIVAPISTGRLHLRDRENEHHRGEEGRERHTARPTRCASDDWSTAVTTTPSATARVAFAARWTASFHAPREPAANRSAPSAAVAVCVENRTEDDRQQELREHHRDASDLADEPEASARASAERADHSDGPASASCRNVRDLGADERKRFDPRRRLGMPAATTAFDHPRYEARLHQRHDGEKERQHDDE